MNLARLNRTVKGKTNFTTKAMKFRIKHVRTPRDFRTTMLKIFRSLRKRHSGESRKGIQVRWWCGDRFGITFYQRQGGGDGYRLLRFGCGGPGCALRGE